MRRGKSQYNDRATPVCSSAITSAESIISLAAREKAVVAEEAAWEPEARSSLTPSNQTCCSVR